MESFLGLIVPLPAEAGALLGRQGWIRQDGWSCRSSVLPCGTAVLAVCAGQGRARAQAAAGWLASRGAVALAVIGLAGGLHPALHPGDLVLFMEKSGELLFAGPDGMLLQVLSGGLAEIDQPVLTKAGKLALFERSGALAVDLESVAVGRVARQAGLPFFALRAVCDPASREVPSEVRACLAEAGRLRAAVLLRAIFRRPQLLGELLRLRCDFAAALKALQQQWQTVSMTALARCRLADMGEEPFSSLPQSPPD
ncbi:MAG: hypothetical protein WDA20_07175 [Desulfuromonadales bacterium]|jgi:adenosylhomocysteine nucleosidase